MIDLILLLFVFAVYYVGFWSGNKYNTLGQMFSAFEKWCKN